MHCQGNDEVAMASHATVPAGHCPPVIVTLRTSSSTSGMAQAHRAWRYSVLAQTRRSGSSEGCRPCRLCGIASGTSSSYVGCAVSTVEGTTSQLAAVCISWRLSRDRPLGCLKWISFLADGFWRRSTLSKTLYPIICLHTIKTCHASRS
jgi:hypothetical protein